MSATTTANGKAQSTSPTVPARSTSPTPATTTKVTRPKPSKPAPKPVIVGENATLTVNPNGTVSVTFDPLYRGGLSSTGKTYKVASTDRGAKVGESGIYLTFQAFVYANPRR